MTGTQLLTNAVALMGGDTSDTTNYQTLALVSINTMLADLFEVNNAILAAKELPPIAEMPTLASLASTIPYRDELTRNCMHYGLARDLGVAEKNANTGFFSAIYDDKRARYDVAAASEVEDLYPESEE